MTSSISSIEIISSVMPDSKIVVWIAASGANAAGVDPNGTKTLLANEVSAFFINIKAVLVNGILKLKKTEMSLFFKDLIIFVLSLISLFVTVIYDPIIVLNW